MTSNVSNDQRSVIAYFHFMFLQSNQINQATKRDHLRKRANTGEFFFYHNQKKRTKPGFFGIRNGSQENCPIPQESNAARVSENLYLSIPVADFQLSKLKFAWNSFEIVFFFFAGLFTD